MRCEAAVGGYDHAPGFDPLCEILLHQARTIAPPGWDRRAEEELLRRRCSFSFTFAGGPTFSMGMRPWSALMPMLGSAYCYLSSRCSFSFTFAHSSASAGAGFFSMIGFHALASSAFNWVHFFWLSGTSSSAKMASTGHSATHKVQSMHSSGSMTSMFGPSRKQSTGQTSTQSVYLHLTQDSVTT